MGFHQGTWIQRFGALGDEAEGVFEEVYPKGWARYGLRRPPIRVDKLPLFIRYTPDYLTTDNLVEVMGVGEDQTLKLKTEKLNQLSIWNGQMPTELFLWDSYRKRYMFIPINDVAGRILEAGELGSFPEGKAYWGVDVNELEAEWTNSS